MLKSFMHRYANGTQNSHAIENAGRLMASNDSFRFTDGTSMSRFCDVLILRNLHSPTRTAAIGCYRVPMDPLYRRAIIQSILGTILFIALIFWPAGTFHYWQGWLFLAVFSASTNAFGIYLALYDKPLLERRLAGGAPHRKKGVAKRNLFLRFFSVFFLVLFPPLGFVYC